MRKPKQKNMDSQKALLYQKEYELVANKVTALSMNFIKGTYIVPVSLVVAFISSYFSKDSNILSLILIFLPLVISLYGYNHIRYMVLQMKAAEYCSHLEEKLNEYYDEDILLWENRLARDSNQMIFETVLFVFVYGINLILLFILGYVNLIKSLHNNFLHDKVVILIALSYFAIILFAISFLVLFGKTAAFKIKMNIDSTYAFKIYQKKFRKRLIMIILIIVFLLPTALMPLIYGFQQDCIKMAQTIDWKSVDTIIVLGNKLSGQGLSEDGIARMDCLIQHLNDNPDKKIQVILSGGKSEAEIMNRYLGSSAGQINIELESNSKTTFQNLKYTEDMTHGNTVIISSDYHVFRIHMLLKKLGLNYKIVPAQTSSLKFVKIWKECYRTIVDMIK